MMQALSDASLIEALDEHYATNIWDWACEEVVTLNEASMQRQRWPREKTYLREVLEIIENERLILVPKSRRMLITWLVALWACHRARYFPNTKIYFQSKKEEDAAEVLDQRVKFIEDHLRTPGIIKPYSTAGGAGGLTRLLRYEHPGDQESWVQAVAQGKDQIRSKTATAVIEDEVEHQDDGHESMTAAMPLLEQEAKVIAIGTSNGPSGYLAQVGADIGFERWAGKGGILEPYKPGYQVHVARMPNGGVWVPIHYSYDKEKTAEWAVKKRLDFVGPSKDADWQKEYEIDFSALSGIPACPAFEEALHVVPDDDFEINPRIPLCIWMDFNVSPMTAAIWQMQNGIMCVDSEIWVDPGEVKHVAHEFRVRHPAHPAEVWVYGDASGNNRGQTARSSYDLFKIAMAGYPSRLVHNVPQSNPHVMDRVNACNAALRPPDGMPRVRIKRRCVEFRKDLKEVRLKPSGDSFVIEKVTDPDKPYSKRTHLFDGWGYAVNWHWPVKKLAAGLEKPKPRPPMVFQKDKLLGGLR